MVGAAMSEVELPPVPGLPNSAQSPRTEAVAEIGRPWCCPEPRCKSVHQLTGVDDGDLTKPVPGESWVCFGQMTAPVEFVYDGAEHANDLRSCHYTGTASLSAIGWRRVTTASTTARCA